MTHLSSATTPITITPSIGMPALPLLTATTPPLRPGIPATVPLWLGLTLKKTRRAVLTPPPWLRAAALERAAAAERATPDDTLLPPIDEAYLEVASTLCSNAAEDVEEVARVRRALDDYGGVRAAKLRRAIRSQVGVPGGAGASATGGGVAVKVTRATRAEVALVRDVVAGVCAMEWRLAREGGVLAGDDTGTAEGDTAGTGGGGRAPPRVAASCGGCRCEWGGGGGGERKDGVDGGAWDSSPHCSRFLHPVCRRRARPTGCALPCHTPPWSLDKLPRAGPSVMSSSWWLSATPPPHAGVGS